jgi:hypothetical protein
LEVRFVNLIHLIDGDQVVDASDNLANSPALVSPNIAEARQRANRLGVVLYVSPALLEIAEQAEPALELSS